jgi:hypothetical protein
MHRKPVLPFLILFLLLLVLSCNLFASSTPEAEVEVPSPQRTKVNATPMEDLPDDEPRVVQGPEGSSLFIDPAALDVESSPLIEISGSGDEFWSESPFTNESEEYLISFGEYEQVGSITMTVPLYGTEPINTSLSPDRVYLAWAQPDVGFPSLVGAKEENGKVTFPVVGSGRYQVIGLLSSESLQSMFNIVEPLTVPTYPQRTPAWCSPTALTNLVQYHQGAWPVGGDGSVWGESSNWYLAGKADQPYNWGYFFHWLLGAGGYTVPANVKQSFSNERHEVFIWNWKGAVHTNYESEDGQIKIVTANYEFAEYLFDAFKAYIEQHVWGANGPSRPVAWGSSLAGHSRTITGSDGERLFYNDPSSGSLNQSLSWEFYRQAVMDSLTSDEVEIIDTVVLHADPRPEEERRGVLWLEPYSDGFSGSVTLLRGPEMNPITNWHWDGELRHDFGFYYEDTSASLPDDPVFESQFQSRHRDDAVEYGFTIFNISDQSYDFRVEVTITSETENVPFTIPIIEASLNGTQKKTFNPAGSFLLKELDTGFYRLQFTLYQGRVVQDVKYVHFRVAPPAFVYDQPIGILTKDAFCRRGPGLVFEDLTAFYKDTELKLIGLNPEGNWGKFETTVGGDLYRCWISLSVVEVYGADQVPILQSPPTPVPTPSDTQAPNVWISHSPSGEGRPTDIEEITFTAEANDDIGVVKIELWITPPGESAQILKTCLNVNSCVATDGPFDSGDMDFWARAYDAANNQGESEREEFYIYVVAR